MNNGRLRGRFKRYGLLSKARNWLAGYSQAGRPLPPDTNRADIPFYRTRVSAEHNGIAKFLRHWRASYDALAKALSACQEKIDKNERACALAKGRAEHFENQRDQAHLTHKDHQNKLQRTVERWEAQWAYWVLLSVVGILDIPVNFLALQYGFSDYPIVAAVLAIVFGLVIATSAHGIGRSAKRFLIAFHDMEASNRSKEMRYLAAMGYALVFAGLCAIMGVALIHLGILRQVFLASLASDSVPSEASIFAQQAAHTLVFGQSNVTLDDRGWMMVFMNAALLVLAAAAAFTNCDSDSQFEKSLHQADAKQLVWEREASKFHTTRDAHTHLYAKKRSLRRDLNFIRTQPLIELNGRAKHLRMELGDFQRGYEFRGAEVSPCLRNLSLEDIAEDITKREDVDAILPDVAQSDDEEDTKQ